MSYETLLFERTDNIGVVTVNRPDKLNALNKQVMADLTEVFGKISTDPEIDAVILTGAGEKAFVAGADIKEELINHDSERAREFAARGQAVFNLIENLGKPVIAAINGFALGGGCELAMACTIRVASEAAKLGQPEINLGIIPGFGGTQRLPRLVGRGIALELILTGDMIDAQEALRIGLVNKVVAPGELMGSAMKTAKKIAAKSAPIVRFTIDAVNRGLEMTLAEGLQKEVDLFALCYTTEDTREGLTAFVEKRKPDFKNK